MINEGLFPVIHASGTPREIGYTHGKEAKRQIDVSINTYREMFQVYSNISWEKAQSYAETFIDSISAYDEDIMEEICGIAEGSGYKVPEILALNVRSEIVLQSGMIDGCTAMAFTPESTQSKETWIAQNWDWKIKQREAYVLLRISQQKKPDVNLFTEAGIVGKLGFNSEGIGVCLNAMGSDAKTDVQTIPLHIALRGILNSKTLSDAIGQIAKMPPACCANLLIASADGQAINIECGPGDFDVLYAEENWIAHTNHFVSPKWMPVIHDTGKNAFPDSYLRYGRARQLIRKRLSEHAIEQGDIRDILRDHTGFPDSICRHEDAMDEEGKRMGTVFSIIMNLDRREMYISSGCPCQSRYNLYKL